VQVILNFLLGAGVPGASGKVQVTLNSSLSAGFPGAS